MTAESFDLEAGQDRYPLRFDMPVKSVFFSLNDIHYNLILVTPAEMERAKCTIPPKQRPMGFPYLASVNAAPMAIDIYPRPTSGLSMSVCYDDEEHAKRARERQDADWIAEYRRYHFS